VHRLSHDLNNLDKVVLLRYFTFMTSLIMAIYFVVGMTLVYILT
jgi:hypothetical protein